MNDLLSKFSRQFSIQKPSNDGSEMTASATSDVERGHLTAGRGSDDPKWSEDPAYEHMEEFFRKTATIQNDLIHMNELIMRLRDLDEQGKILTRASELKALGSRQEEELKNGRLLAQSLKKKLLGLVADNKASSLIPASGRGTAPFRQRQAVTQQLSSDLERCTKRFQELHDAIVNGNRDLTRRRYYTVTGEVPDESTIDKLNTATNRESLLQRAVEVQGKPQIDAFIQEIEERQEGIKGITSELLELHQLFLDMSVIVVEQGQILDNIELNIGEAYHDVSKGNVQLGRAVSFQRSTRRWTCICILILAVIIFIIALSVYLSVR